MTALRRRLLEDMQVRHLSPHTQRASVNNIAQFARHFGQSPAALGPEEIRTYQVYLTTDRKLAPSSIGLAVSALRFLYAVTLKQAVADRGGDPGAEEAADLAGGAEPRGGGPVSRQRHPPHAPHDPDDVLRGHGPRIGSFRMHARPTDWARRGATLLPSGLVAREAPAAKQGDYPTPVELPDYTERRESAK